MITEHDLKQAIAECQGERYPNANTCIKLAAFLTIQRELFGEQNPPTYSFAPSPQIENPETEYESDTEFGQAVQGKDLLDVLSIMDELMSTLKITNRRLYDAVMRRL